VILITVRCFLYRYLWRSHGFKKNKQPFWFSVSTNSKARRIDQIFQRWQNLRGCSFW